MKCMLFLLIFTVLAMPQKKKDIQNAVLLYFQSQYDSSIVELNLLLSREDLKAKDSLIIYQYKAMAQAKIGLDSLARQNFKNLLTIDSLWQLPRNEDPLVISTFDSAKSDLNVPPSLPSPASSPTIDTLVAGIPPPEEKPPTKDTSEIKLTSYVSPSYAPMPENPSAESQSPLETSSREFPTVSLALGAMPLGTGWMAANKKSHGLTHFSLQLGGALLSMYASHQLSLLRKDGRLYEEQSPYTRWQVTQRVSLAVLFSSYLVSVFTSIGRE